MMSPAAIDRFILRAPTWLLTGLACWCVGLELSPMLVGGLGLLGAVFAGWRDDPSLTVFAAPLLAFFGAVFLACTFSGITGLLAGRAPLMLVLDWLVATSAMQFHVRFLLAVVYWNRHMLYGA